MRGNDTPTSEAVEKAEIATSAGLEVTLDSSEQLRAGVELMRVDSTMALSRGPLVLPDSAVRRIDGSPIVFVADTLPNRFQPRFVHIAGSRADGRVDVTSGLLTGDRVVIKGAAVLEANLERYHSGPYHSRK